MEFKGDDRILPTMRGKPAYLGVAVNPTGLIRLKPAPHLRRPMIKEST